MSRFLWALTALAAIALVGCASCKPARYAAARPYCNSCGDGPLPPRATQPPPLAKPLVPVPSAPVVPRDTAVAPVTPAPDSTPPPADIERPMPRPSDPPPPAPPPVESDRLSQAGETRPLPQLGAPGPSRTEVARPPSTYESREPSAAVPSRPPVANKTDGDLPDPIDIPAFAVVRKNVASGQKPFPPGGINWLKEKGYTTILHLRAPEESSAAARREFEKRGLRYVTLQASPERLTKELYEEFVAAVNDVGNQPLYVYDKDGSVAGGLWYLYFRVHLSESEDTARSEARRLGLLFDEDPKHRTMWLAAQMLLKTLKP